MSKHNYTQYSNKKNEYTQPEVTTVEDNDVAFVGQFVATETATCEQCGQQYEPNQDHVCVTNEPEETTATGTVVNCVKLNVRAEPNATAGIVCAMNVDSEMKIDINKSTNEWYKVCTATGIEGYCMKKFVNISQ
jgi:hypothetical protein